MSNGSVLGKGTISNKHNYVSLCVLNSSQCYLCFCSGIHPCAAWEGQVSLSYLCHIVLFCGNLVQYTHTHWYTHSSSPHPLLYTLLIYQFFFFLPFSSVVFQITFNFRTRIRIKTAQLNTEKLIWLCIWMNFLPFVIDPPVPSSSLPPTQWWPHTDDFRFWQTFFGIQTLSDPTNNSLSVYTLLPSTSCHPFCIHSDISNEQLGDVAANQTVAEIRL